MYAGKPCNNSVRIACLEFIKLGAIHNPGNNLEASVTFENICKKEIICSDLSNIKGFFKIATNNAVEVIRWEKRFLWSYSNGLFLFQIEFADCTSCKMNGVFVVQSVVVGHTRGSLTITTFNYNTMPNADSFAYVQWRSAPPRSSAETSSPVAAFTSGGPARKIVPWFLTIILSSAIAGMYAPPAVQMPKTTATFKNANILKFWQHYLFFCSPVKCLETTCSLGWRKYDQNALCRERPRLDGAN